MVKKDLCNSRTRMERYSITSPQIWAVPVGCLLMAAFIVVSGQSVPLFLFFNEWLNAIIPPWLWGHITNGGDGLVAIALALPFCFNNPRFVLMVMGSGALMSFLPTILKAAIGLPRPLSILPAETFIVIGSSYKSDTFPSGHVATTFWIIALIFLMYRRPSIRIAVFGIGIMVGLSRIACGVHWPADIFGGIFLGWVLSAGAYLIFIQWPRVIKPVYTSILQYLPVIVVTAPLLWYETAYDGTRASYLGFSIAMVFLWIWRYVTYTSANQKELAQRF